MNILRSKADDQLCQCGRVESGQEEGEVANCSNVVTGNFGVLKKLASSGPNVAVFLHGWLH